MGLEQVQNLLAEGTARSAWSPRGRGGVDSCRRGVSTPVGSWLPWPGCRVCHGLLYRVCHGRRCQPCRVRHICHCLPRAGRQALQSGREGLHLVLQAVESGSYGCQCHCCLIRAPRLSCLPCDVFLEGLADNSCQWLPWPATRGELRVELLREGNGAGGFTGPVR